MARRENLFKQSNFPSELQLIKSYFEIRRTRGKELNLKFKDSEDEAHRRFYDMGRSTSLDSESIPNLQY